MGTTENENEHYVLLGHIAGAHNDLDHAVGAFCEGEYELGCQALLEALSEISRALGFNTASELLASLGVKGKEVTGER